MTDATDLLASVNLYPYDASANPGGLAAGGYLVEEGGVSLVARAVRAMGAATASVQALSSLDPAGDQADANAITSLKAPAADDVSLASDAATAARAAVPPFDFTLL